MIYKKILCILAFSCASPQIIEHIKKPNIHTDETFKILLQNPKDIPDLLRTSRASLFTFSSLFSFDSAELLEIIQDFKYSNARKILRPAIAYYALSGEELEPSIISFCNRINFNAAEALVNMKQIIARRHIIATLL